MAPVTICMSRVKADTYRLFATYFRRGESKMTSEKFCHWNSAGKKADTSMISAFVFSALKTIQIKGKTVNTQNTRSTMIFPVF